LVVSAAAAEATDRDAADPAVQADPVGSRIAAALAPSIRSNRIILSNQSSRGAAGAED